MEKNRTWKIKANTGDITGPFSEEDFQEMLRAGNIPFFFNIKSSEMDEWKPLVQVISDDESFHRTSTIPPEPPPEN